MLIGALAERTSLALGTVCFALFIMSSGSACGGSCSALYRLIPPLRTPITPGSVL